MLDQLSPIAIVPGLAEVEAAALAEVQAAALSLRRTSLALCSVSASEDVRRAGNLCWTLADMAMDLIKPVEAAARKKI